jgi:predicted Zn-dependent peptidase
MTCHLITLIVNANILKVTSEDIKDAFSRRVKPEQLIRVIVGEAS